MRENVEEYLGIDMKPHYAEVIEQRVPMHIWDQWIRDKLAEVAQLHDDNCDAMS